MKRIVVFALVCASLLGVRAHSLTVNVEEPGTLGQLVGDDAKYSTDDLTVTGTIGWADLEFIYSMCRLNNAGQEGEGVLRRLDMSGARIVYRGEETYNEINYDEEFHDDELPIAAFHSCSSLEEVRLPATCRRICNWAFSGATI
jgi:hypothetical protein